MFASGGDDHERQVSNGRFSYRILFLVVIIVVGWVIEERRDLGTAIVVVMIGS